MMLGQEIFDEINVLLQFDRCNTQEGIKIHSSADHRMINAAKRLHAKGLITQPDGGYLTFAGRETAEHAVALQNMLTLGDARRVTESPA